MTPDFILGQLRLAAVALVAYLTGKGVFTPADATLATALGTSLGPILIPWAFSIYMNYKTVRVSANSNAAAVAAVEKTGDTSKAAAIAAVQMSPEGKP